MRRADLQGNILAIVVAILFILVTVVMALHQSQSRAVRNVTRGEAELQFRQGYEFEVAKLLATPGTPPDWVKVFGESELVGERRLPQTYAKDLWDRDKFPNLDPAVGDFPPGFHTFKITPDTSDQTLKVFDKKHMWLVTRDGGGYAAYAPEGKVTLTEAVGWANPTFDDERKSTEAFAGVQAVVACKTDLEVDKLVYGSAYSLEGPITLGSSSQGGYGFQGSFPLRRYDKDLTTKLDTIRSSFQSSARSGNKTPEISGGALQTVGTMVSMLFGGSGQPSLSLEQAWKVPFPMIPGFSNTVPGLVYEFWFHMPNAPDTTGFGGATGDSEATQKILRIKADIEKLDEEIDGRVTTAGKPTQRKDADGNPIFVTVGEQRTGGLREQVRNATGAEKDRLREKLNEKLAERDELYRKLRNAQDDLKEEGRQNEEKVRDQSASPPSEPATRREDDELVQRDRLVKKQGILGWAYGPIFENFFGLLLDVFTGQFQNIANRFFNEVRVVHFGRKDNDPEMSFNDGWQVTATFTVPPGRTFEYNSNLEVTGDLWLQKGSVMHVAGNLDLVNPNPGSRNPLKPAGKLILEEGSVLVVDGDLNCAGQSNYGSLWVSSPPGRLAPISTAIIVQGNANFPNGSYSATNLEDAARWLVDKGELSSLKDAPEFMATLTNKVAPNLAKVVGPFHTRVPFFARYASTFQLTMVPTPIGTIPVPTVIPLPRRNILVPIFRGFSFVYTPAMNWALGENLYLHSDWWGFGDGVVPVIVKIDPERMVRGLGGVNLGPPDFSNIDWEDHLKDMSTTILEGAMQFVIEIVAKQVVKEITAAAIPGGGLVTIALDEALAALDIRDNSLERLTGTIVEATIGPIVTELDRWVDGIRTQVEDGIADGYLRAITGPMIYADTITVGDGSSRLMAGMLVAKNNIVCDTRHFVGSLTSLNGNITAQRVYYNPHFTRASFYKPKDTKSNFLERGLQFEYANDFKGTTALDIDTGVRVIATEAWNK